MDFINREDCQNILLKFVKSTNFELKSFEVVNFHNALQGLVGEHFILRIQYSCNEKTQRAEFFMKTLSTNPFMLNFSKLLLVYEKEEFFYNFLTEVEKCNIDTSFAPKGLFFKPYITVLEDLSNRYKGIPKRQFFDLEHCEIALETVARFHAASVIFEARKKAETLTYSLENEHKVVLEDKFESKEESLATQWLQSAVGGVFALIDEIPEIGAEFKPKLLEALGESPKGSIEGILHSDLWTSNFLFAYKNGKPAQSKLLDFQLIKYGFLEQDVVGFLMTNTTRELRAQHFKTLLLLYYKKLEELLSSASVKLPPSRDFILSCDQFKIAGKIHALVDHSYTFLRDEIYSDVMKTEESFRKFLFDERGRYVLESYNKDDEYRKVLFEDILELRDLLAA